jgi:hypothetical protein
LVFSGFIALAESTKKETLAISKAEKWPSIVDDSKYTESWNGTSELFRNTVPLEQWEL